MPGKNIKLLGGKPLVVYSIEQAKKSKLISHTIVSTDDEGIAEVAKKNGADVPFIRPKELAEDDTPHVPVLQHAVEFMEKRLNTRFEGVVTFQPTSPFRTQDDIDATIRKLLETPEATSAVSVYEVESAHHPMKIKKNRRIKSSTLLH